MFSSAVSIGSRLKNWKMKPILLRRNHVRSLSSSSVITVPSIATDPEVGLSRPARMCISVDLPDPDGPMIAVSFPRSTSSETPLRACTAVSPSPYCRETSLAETTVAGERSSHVASPPAAISMCPPLEGAGQLPHLRRAAIMASLLRERAQIGEILGASGKRHRGREKMSGVAFLY